MTQEDIFKVSPRWREEAFDCLCEFVRQRTQPFMAEDFISWSAGKITSAYDRRNFGPVMLTAAKRGLIRANGYAPARTSNMSPKVQWVRT